jgi:hypothetical protein
VLGEVKSVTSGLNIELKALGLDQGLTFCVAVRDQGTNALGVGIFFAFATSAGLSASIGSCLL